MALKYCVCPVTAFEQNCTIFWCTETMEAVIVDAGGDRQLLLDKIDELKVKLTALWVTHAHIDHAGAVADIAEQCAVPIEGPHQDDQFWIDALAEQSRMFGVNQGARPFTPTHWLKQGDHVQVGKHRFEVLHCPGHTPGHVVFYNAEHQIAQVGDVIFQDSIGRTDFPRGNHADLINSIRKRLLPLGDNVKFIPGHGPMSTFGRERQFNPYCCD